jgi:hypothetical protein
MFNPFVNNLDTLKDEEIEQKILELSKKYTTSQQLGKIDLLTQIQTLITMYREEQTKRRLSRKNQLDDDLNQLINVD